MRMAQLAFGILVAAQVFGNADAMSLILPGWRARRG
jgi:hypothetical protein